MAKTDNSNKKVNITIPNKIGEAIEKLGEKISDKFQDLINSQKVSDSITTENTKYSKKSIKWAKISLYSSIIMLVISNGAAYVKNYFFDEETTKDKKENISKLIGEIEDHFKPHNIAERIDTAINPDVKAVYDFQKSVINLIKLREPHDKTLFGDELKEVYHQVKININQRFKYDYNLTSIISDVKNVKNNERHFEYDVEFYNQRITGIDVEMSQDALIDLYQSKIDSWISKDKNRNNKVLSSLKRITKSAMLEDVNRAIYPLIEFAKNDSNYIFREMFYDYLLDMNSIYLSDINNRFNTSL